MRLSSVSADVYFDEKNFKDFSFFHTIIRNNLRNTMVILLLISVAGFNFSAGRTSYGVSFIGFTAGLVLLYYLLYMLSVSRQVKLLKLREKLQFAYSLTVDDMGLTVKYDEEHVKTYSWAGMHKVYRVPEYVYFYVTKTQAYVLPFRDLNGVTPDALWMVVVFNTEKTMKFDKLNFMTRP